MSSTDVTIPAAFKDVMREKILAAYVEFVPKEQLDILLANEISAFFETEMILTVAETKIEFNNPNYKPNGYSNYDNKPKLERTALAFGSKMTPFRQLVWSELHKHIQPTIEGIFKDNNSAVNTELNNWFAETVQPVSGNVSKDLFTQLSAAMSASMFHRSMTSAIAITHSNMMASFATVGVDVGRIPTVPFQQVPPII